MTSTERRRTWSERMDPRNWSLVAKLAVVGLVPTVLALAIGAFRVVDQANVAEDLGQGSGLVEAHQQVGALTQALQSERAAAVVFVGGNRLGDRNAVDSAQAATDEAVRRTNDTLAVAEQQAPQLATAKRQADTALGQLPIIRSQVGAAPTPASDITTRYTSAVQRVLALDRALLGQLQTSDTAGLATALGSTAAATEALELERSVIGGVIAASQLQEAQKAVVNGAEASYQSAASDYQAALTPQQVDQFGNFATDPANAQRQSLRDTVMATPAGERVTADASAWNAAVDASAGVVRSADRQAEEQFVGGRAQAAEQAGNTAGLNSVLLMLGLLLTVGIILLLGRQLVRSLRVLRTSALDVAERRLPQAVQSMRSGQAPSALVEPVPLDSRDEIGEVARAFDAVHGQAIRLAADQAALQQNVNSMFVNLSRRSQALVERQLQLIEQLESNEQDPDQLSNLFQLDHLATRMRRNSENLLVLAGTDLAKRNVAPVQVVDVLRAAVSEVEQYQRVVVQTPPTATIAGRAANDLVHLLAELLDNATNFSPPDSQVVMSTTRTADESLLIEISDRGVGMADSELSDANQRLSGPSEVDVSASRRMGLFVVGRLAARHRVGVRLSSASGAGRSGGLSASVTVPPQLVPSAAPAVVEQPPEPAGTGAWGAIDAPPAPADRQAVALNGAAHGGIPTSAVAGADGPVAPTFGSGATGAPSRNGAAPKLPTRTPGSALRSNPTGPGSTDGQGAAPNGSAVHDVSAFLPSGPRTNGSTGEGDGSGPDMFTPASDGPPSGGYRPTPPGEGPPPPRGERGPSGRPDGNGPAEGPYGTGTGDPADSAEPTGTRETRPTSDEKDRDSGAPYRTLLGAAGAAGAGGAFAGVFGRRRDGDDGPSTVEISRVEDTEPAAGAEDDAPVVDEVETAGPEEAVGAEEAVEAEAPDTPHAVESPDGPDRRDAPATGELGDAPEPFATTEVPEAPAPAGPSGSDDDGEQVTDVPGDRATGTAPDDLPIRTTDVRVRPAAPQAQDDGGADEAAHGGAPGGGRGIATAGGAAVAGAAAAFAANGTGGPDPERAPDHDADRRPLPETADGAPDRGPGSGPHSGPDSGPDDSETDTTAFPSLRPPREPMGGVRPPAPGRGGPLRPAPARRPVMPPTGSAPAGPVHGGPPPGVPGGAAPYGPRPPEGQRPIPRSPADAEQDELFAPSVPVEGDRGQLRRPGGLESARAGGGFDISQTTPIFEEIASAWFRSNRSVPVRWQDGAPEQAPGGSGPGPDGQAQGGGPANGTAAPGGEQARPRPTPRPGPAPGGPAPDAPAAGTPGEIDDAGFASPADDVWRQAAAGAGETEQAPDEVTSAGLPKRRPRANLLPGSAAGSTVLSPPASTEARSAESVRGRLASYQQGVRQGRESRTTRTGDDVPGSDHTGDRPNTTENEESQ